jgi:thiol-disulfide isomerase/thioredoxin
MKTARISLGLLAIIVLGCARAADAAAPPTAAQMLQFKPRQPNVSVSTPSEAEIPACRVELIKGQKLANGKVASGWILKDATGRPLRRFFDSDGDNQIDVWSYYLNGEECYREIDSNLNGKADQYRWLGANGSKWGVDVNEDGRIDSWRVISPEEVSQEILAAVQTRDFSRLQALMITKPDLDSLELPQSEVARIKNKLTAAGNTFQATTAALIKLTEKTRWVHLETSAPECTPADALGAKTDLIRHKYGTILYSDGDKLNDFLQTGEMILVGRAWRIVEAPVPGSFVQNAGSGGYSIPDKIKDLVDRLKPIDEKYKDAKTPALVVEYNLARASVLEQIVTALKGDNSDDWVKQVADCFSTAAQNGSKDAYDKLVAFKNQIAKSNPASSVAAYVAYREMSADYARKLGEIKQGEMTKLQEQWKDRLAKFVQDYPTAEDAPDALMQLGMVSEFMGKETDAKNWYTDLVKNHAKSPMAAKAAGAIRRLRLDGQEFELVAQTLGGREAFDAKSLKGKVVIVYYWASWNTQCVADFAKIKEVMAKNGTKGVELLCVNLDNSEGDAIKFLQNTPVPGTHVYQQGGLDSPPAVNYGIMVLPNMFVVGADGKVASRSAQVATFEEELKKLLK